MRLSGLGYLLKEGIKSIWSNRMMSIASIGVLVSCLLLTGAAELITLNVSTVVDEIGGENVTRVFLDQEVTDLEAVYIQNEIGKIGNVSNTMFVSKDDAILEYEDTLREDIFSQMQGEGNPLPNSVDVTLTDLSLYDETMAQITSIDGVDSVRDTREIASKLTSLSTLVSSMSLWIVLALSLISIFIISNTIRMTMYSRRFEISIMKSVGATDTFIRIPFVFEGMIIGLISGVVGSLLLTLVYDAVMKGVQNIIHFKFIPYGDIAVYVWVIFIVSGMLIGMLGSVISIGRYLRKEGNELLGW
ncbi:MAG: permease-like cell division protein FtsX [Ruminococcus sp.]|nr:permease-like cell division protein FtsX [Ruminococcus sp.]